MSLARSPTNYFLLEAFDRAQWCPVLQARFKVPDLKALQTILCAQADDDPELQHTYSLDEAELAAVIAAFGVSFDPAPLGMIDPEVSLYRMQSIRTAPYLVHTGYELPLLLDGRKKLAKMYGTYPPMAFDGEERFNHWVAQGVLHRVEVLEPFDLPVQEYEGHRTVYYTPKGEEWRIPAMQLVWRAAGKAGGWNEYFERLEGMLFGYEDWQNDWWIEAGLQRGGIGGASVCCAVTAVGLAWLEAAGFRALPPCDKPALAVMSCDDSDFARMRALLLEEPDSIALVRFVVPLWRARDLLPVSPDGDGRWLVPSDCIPELNRLLRNAVVVVMRRDDPS
jgi:hypothetical protein